MTDVQLYLVVWLPTLAVLVGILMNAVMLSRVDRSLNARITRLEERLERR
jgi:hypothetical protein